MIDRIWFAHLSDEESGLEIISQVHIASVYQDVI